MVQLLLDRGAGVNQANTNGYTPLFIAAREGHLPVVQLLLDRGAGVNQADNEGVTPLYIAAQEGHLPVVKLLLDRGADVNPAMTNEGYTPLLIAAREGHLPVVQLLLDRGAGVNQADNEGVTPLYIAAQEGHLDVVQLLLGRGADVEVYAPCFGTAREVATEEGHTAVAQLIAASEEARTLAQQGNVEPFRAQIEAAELYAPMAQWVPALPAAARTVLLTWARSSVQDARVCYAVFYADLDLVPPPLPHGALVHDWRGRVGHGGVVGIRRLIVSFRVHLAAWARASEKNRALAQQGNVEPLRAQIEAAELSSPLAQWVPALPAAAWTVLMTWARAVVQDAGACYAVFYADLDLVSPPPPQALVHEWRGIVGHDGVIGIQRLTVSFLVHPKAGTRRALWELAAMGDLGAAAGVEAVSVEAVVAAARRAAVVRAKWAKVQEPYEAAEKFFRTQICGVRSHRKALVLC